jgi:predicted small metal-binding protein
MDEKQYKELSCKDFRSDCDFTVRAENEAEILMKCRDHACNAHGKCWNSPETDARIRRRIRDVKV